MIPVHFSLEQQQHEDQDCIVTRSPQHRTPDHHHHPRHDDDFWGEISFDAADDYDLPKKPRSNPELPSPRRNTENNQSRSPSSDRKLLRRSKSSHSPSTTTATYQNSFNKGKKNKKRIDTSGHYGPKTPVKIPATTNNRSPSKTPNGSGSSTSGRRSRSPGSMRKLILERRELDVSQAERPAKLNRGTPVRVGATSPPRQRRHRRHVQQRCHSEDASTLLSNRHPAIDDDRISKTPDCRSSSRKSVLSDGGRIFINTSHKSQSHKDGLSNEEEEEEGQRRRSSRSVVSLPVPQTISPRSKRGERRRSTNREKDVDQVSSRAQSTSPQRCQGSSREIGIPSSPMNGSSSPRERQRRHRGRSRNGRSSSHHRRSSSNRDPEKQASSLRSSRSPSKSGRRRKLRSDDGYDNGLDNEDHVNSSREMRTPQQQQQRRLSSSNGQQKDTSRSPSRSGRRRRGRSQGGNSSSYHQRHQTRSRSRSKGPPSPPPPPPNGEDNDQIRRELETLISTTDNDSSPKRQSSRVGSDSGSSHKRRSSRRSRSRSHEAEKHRGNERSRSLSGGRYSSGRPSSFNGRLNRNEAGERTPSSRRPSSLSSLNVSENSITVMTPKSLKRKEKGNSRNINKWWKLGTKAQEDRPKPPQRTKSGPDKFVAPNTLRAAEPATQKQVRSTSRSRREQRRASNDNNDVEKPRSSKSVTETPSKQRRFPSSDRPLSSRSRSRTRRDTPRRTIAHEPTEEQHAKKSTRSVSRSRREIQVKSPCQARERVESEVRGEFCGLLHTAEDTRVSPRRIGGKQRRMPKGLSSKAASNPKICSIGINNSDDADLFQVTVHNKSSMRDFADQEQMRRPLSCSSLTRVIRRTKSAPLEKPSSVMAPASLSNLLADMGIDSPTRTARTERTAASTIFSSKGSGSSNSRHRRRRTTKKDHMTAIDITRNSPDENNSIRSEDDDDDTIISSVARKLVHNSRRSLVAAENVDDIDEEDDDESKVSYIARKLVQKSSRSFVASRNVDDDDNDEDSKVSAIARRLVQNSRRCLVAAADVGSDSGVSSSVDPGMTQNTKRSTPKKNENRRRIQSVDALICSSHHRGELYGRGNTQDESTTCGSSTAFDISSQNFSCGSDWGVSKMVGPKVCQPQAVSN